MLLHISWMRLFELIYRKLFLVVARIGPRQQSFMARISIRFEIIVSLIGGVNRRKSVTPWNYNWWNILEINSRIGYVCKREMGFFTFLFGQREPKWKSITRNYLFITACKIMWSWRRNKISISFIGQVIISSVRRRPGTLVPNSDAMNLERVKSGIYLLNILDIFNRKVSIW